MSTDPGPGPDPDPDADADGDGDADPGDGEGQTVDADGVEIVFDDVGVRTGPPVVLLHGFASDRATNWRDTGWYEALTDAGRRVIAPDLRGHGESDKPHDPAAYGLGVMAADVVRLLDHLGIDEADVVGYSMGGRVAVHLLVDHPDRVNAAVLGGVGPTLVRGAPNQDEIVAALEADDLEAVKHPVGQRFRAFADRHDGDLEALAAVMRAMEAFDVDRLSTVPHPVLVVAGEDDSVVDDPLAFAAELPAGEGVVIEERNHMTAVGDPQLLEAVVAFLAESGL